MIERDAFTNAWRDICERFGREYSAPQMAAYYEYLSERMTTEDFVPAARYVWSNLNFFPRPVDFMLPAAAAEWPRVLKAVELYRPPDGAWVEHWRALSERSRAACKRLGGVDAMRVIFERETAKRLMDAWIAAYEQEVACAPCGVPMLAPSAEPAPRQLRVMP